MNTETPALQSIVEAMVLAAENPISLDELQRWLPEFEASEIRRTVSQLKLEYSGLGRGLHLVEVAGGIQFRTNVDIQPFVLRMFEQRPTRLSKAAMESLAIIAYKQPVTRAQVDSIRGVDSANIVKKLLDLGLVLVVGRMDDIGRPNLYGTTPKFLELFGINTLEDLPPLGEADLNQILDRTEELENKND